MSFNAFRENKILAKISRIYSRFFSKSKLTSSMISSAGGITLDLRSLWYRVIINLSTGVIPLRDTPVSSVMHNVCPGRFLNSSVHVSCNSNCNINTWKKLLSCQQRVTVTSCFVYKVIMDLLSINHLRINPIRRIG